MCVINMFRLILIISVLGNVRNEQKTEKAIEYEHQDDSNISEFEPEMEEDYDYIKKTEIINGLPTLLKTSNNTYILGNKSVTLLCRAANALIVYYKCNDGRIEINGQSEYMDPKDGVRVIEVELNVTRNNLEEHFRHKYSCECLAWNNKGHIRSQTIYIEIAYIEEQFRMDPQSVTAEVRQLVSFHCSPPSGVPPVTIKWVRNGFTLKATGKSLVLPRVGKHDSGNYTCMAENIAGRRKSNVAVLTVYDSWSDWSVWSPCSQECIRVRDRQCLGICSGATVQYEVCIDGLCPIELWIYNNSTTVYVGIGITIAVLASILFLCCRCRSVRPGYTAAETGKSYVYSQPEGPALYLTHFRDEPYMARDNQYGMPQLRESYAFPMDDRNQQQSSASNYCEINPYIPSEESTPSYDNKSRTIASRSNGSSSQIDKAGTYKDVTVTLLPGSSKKSYRDQIHMDIIE